ALASPHPRAHARGVPDLLRPPLPESGARGGAAAAPLTRVCATPRAGRRVRREVGLGAPQLVRTERAGGPRWTAPAGVRGPDMVARDRGRAPGDSRARRTLRRDLLLEVRRHRTGRARPPPAALRQRRPP